MLKALQAAAAATALVACTATAPENDTVADNEDLGPRPRSDCYTVVLFDGFEIKDPPEGTPPEHAAFLGEWRFGAWDGLWCHDLIVTEITKDGRVKIMDLHAPYEPWNQPATAFARTGRIDNDGRLRFRHGTTDREYHLDDGRLVAFRSGQAGEYTAMLRKPGSAPPPQRRPEDLQDGGESLADADTGLQPAAEGTETASAEDL
ncbi:MAG: hypothetical protein AAF677_15930 [Pseudomonadota bacterium]